MWLLPLIHKDDQLKPLFAMYSTINWMHSLSYEITQEHGNSHTNQYESCKRVFSTIPRRRVDTPTLGVVYGTLYYSLNFALTLITGLYNGKPWTYNSIVVVWYYTVYNAIRAILISHGAGLPDTHEGVIRVLRNSGLYRELPHPINIEAQRVKGENYESILPLYPKTTYYDLSRNFENSRDVARGMLIAYLNGTAIWKTEKEKKKILKHRGVTFTNFRTKIAQQYRDRYLPESYNFMDCALRYRGKSNYRDSIFLSYGTIEREGLNSFPDSLSKVARFVYLCSFAFIEKRLGRPFAESFVRDVSENLRSVGHIEPEHKFWDVL